MARAEMLQGSRLDFDTESARLYDAVSPHHSRAYYEALVAQIDALLPGDGTVSDRVNALRAQLIIPADKLHAVMDAAIRAGRERTLRYIALPEGEDFILEFSPTSRGAATTVTISLPSLIQIIRLARYIDRAGHSAATKRILATTSINVLLERDLVAASAGWNTASIRVSPAIPDRRGTAN